MYGGFDVYKVYLGVKLHFTSKTYDYIKYGEKLMQHLIVLQRERIDISFIS